MALAGRSGALQVTAMPQFGLRSGFQKILLQGKLITHILQGDNKTWKSVPCLFLATWILCCSGCSPAARGSFSSHPHASGVKRPQSLGLLLLGLSQGSKLKRERINMSPRKRESEEGWQFRFVDFSGITSLCIKTLSNFGQDWWDRSAQIWTLAGLLNSQQFKIWKAG